MVCLKNGGSIFDGPVLGPSEGGKEGLRNKRIDGPRSFTLLKIVFQGRVKEDIGVNKDPAIAHGFRLWREWISSSPGRGS